MTNYSYTTVSHLWLVAVSSDLIHSFTWSMNIYLVNEIFISYKCLGQQSIMNTKDISAASVVQCKQLYKIYRHVSSSAGLAQINCETEI